MSESKQEEAAEAAAAPPPPPAAAGAGVTTVNEDVEMSVQDLIKNLRILHTGDDAEKASALTELQLLIKGDILLSDTPSEWENCLTPFDGKMVLEMPFLALPDEEAGGAVSRQESRMAKYMSRDTKTVKRAPLNEAYRFKVVFEPYAVDEDRDLLTAPDFVGNPSKKKVQRAVRSLLERGATGYPNKPEAKQEVRQLGSFADMIQPLLVLFGYKMRVEAPPADDFTFTFQAPENNDKTVVMVGEGKDATSLPQGPLSPNLSHQLCTFGFVTWLVASYVMDEGLTKHAPLESLRETVEMKLRLRASVATTSNQGEKKAEKKGKVKLNAGQTKPYEEALSRVENDSDFDDVVTDVLNALDSKEISPQGALSLWAAVVQACVAAVPKGNQFTLVMSIKSMWFIKLRVIDGKCHVCISERFAVGSPNFNLRLLSFLNKARTEGSMDQNDQKKWEQSLSTSGDKNDDSGERGADSPDTSHGQKPSSKKRKTAEKKSQDTRKKTVQSNKTGVVASLIDEESVMEQEFLSVDKHGVVVPYFHQIREEVRVLGGGRCGQVKKIKWGDGFAAKKEYIMDPEDDGRDSNEVFRHELHVYFMMQSLWGKYVPTLLFYKDWPGRPYLGLEIGEPMPPEWEDWSEEEDKQADAAIAAVRGLGWNHGDIEARNFVRLTQKDKATSIALIDFEDASYVGT